MGTLNYKDLKSIGSITQLKVNQEVILVPNIHSNPTAQHPVDVILEVSGCSALTYDGVMLGDCAQDGLRVYLTGRVVEDAVISSEAQAVLDHIRGAYDD